MCGCYDGRHACSHLTAFLHLIRCAQRCDHKQEYFEKSMPDNPIKLQNFITLIENIGLTNKRKKARNLMLNENKILTCAECVPCNENFD